MPQTLPALRMNLDFVPSPVEGRPGLLIRDPYGYSDVTLIIPPPLVAALECFDGVMTDADLREILFRATGDLDTRPLAEHLRTALAEAGFLHDETYEQMSAARARQFAESPVRLAAHAGGAYPDDPGALREEFDAQLGSAPAGQGTPVAIAAPHVSPFGGWPSYRAAYQSLTPDLAGRTFVVLGTSHYGQPDRLGLTRKPFSTPYGETRTDLGLVDRLARELGEAALMEDYCHAVEHSIEFQVVMLQHLYGPQVRVLPLLCGAYARSIHEGGLPETAEEPRRILGALGDMAARESNRLVWVLGVDMAHIGRRYGDPLRAVANEGAMQAVAARDRERIAAIARGDAPAYWDLVQQNQDDLKWCGASPFYTFLRAVPAARGELRHYEQWNIDEESVVTFAGLSFSAA